MYKVLILFLFFLSFISGCNAKSEQFKLVIIKNEVVIKEYNLNEIIKLPQKTFIQEGSIETGPNLAYFMTSNEIKDILKISVITISGEAFNLGKDLNPEDLILEIVNKSTLKLVSAKLHKDQWIKDVSAISFVTNP